MTHAASLAVRLLTVLCAAVIAHAQAPSAEAPSATAPPSATLPSGTLEKQALEKLATENLVEKERLTQKLRKLAEERDETALRYSLQQEKLKLELSELESQHRRQVVENALRDETAKQERRGLEKLAMENLLEKERLAQKLRSLNAEREEAAARYGLLQEKLKLELAQLESQHRRLAAENALTEEKGKQELLDLRQKRERQRLEAELEREKMQLQVARHDIEKSRIDLEARQIELKSRKLKFEAEEIESKTTALLTDLMLREKREEWKSQTNKEPDYVAEPFANGVLTVSDRRIALNGPIVRGVADHVTERIHFYNNKSESLPIFILIDRSPGGSVMEGYRILKAMRASKAPVYVVVRSFAASMAAVIAALAPRSFAYPNAVILHHQMSSFVFGNMTQMKEQLEIAKEWYRRLGDPVAQKMGVSLDAFTQQMYSHNSDGDWDEFADKAKKLKWVDEIVHEIRETGIAKDPDRTPKPKAIFEWSEETDSKNERFVRLPRLEPFDLYYLYNRDGYYR